MRFGFHVSISDGWRKTLQRAVERRCTALQIFTSAPVQWARAELDPQEAAWFTQALRTLDIQPLFVHAIYLLNLAAADSDLWRKSRENLAGELQRAGMVGARGVVVHLGSIGESGTLRRGIKRVAQALDYAINHAPEGVQVVLENCAGQGNLIGSSPEQIGQIIDASNNPHRLAACIDTAHAFEQGYAIHTQAGLNEFLAQCEAAFGVGRIELIHANDSKTSLASNVDRHQHIGKGEIGRAGFEVIMNHPALADLPFIMETPEQESWHQRDMRAIRSCVTKENRPPLPSKPRKQPD